MVVALIVGPDRQDVGEHRRRGGIGRQRGPARLQVEPLRRDVVGEEFLERRDGRRSGPVLTPAAVEARAGEADIAEERAEHDRVAALAMRSRFPQAVQCRCRSIRAAACSLDRPALDGGEQRSCPRRATGRPPRAGPRPSRRYATSSASPKVAVIRCDLEQDPDPHGVPPVR